jgi:hypothetical protein
MSRILFGFTVVCCFYCKQGIAQDATEANRVRLLIAGGLLGKLDGFCELPDYEGSSRKPFDFRDLATRNLSEKEASESCPPGTTPLGGLYGLQEQIQLQKATDGYVLLTGNNFPKDFDITMGARSRSFWRRFASLGADVVALGQDDFLRAVFPARLEGSVKDQRFSVGVRDFLSDPQRRFLASNAGVRTSRKAMNKVWDKGYELMVSADESVAWTTGNLKIALPCICDRIVRLKVTENGNPLPDLVSMAKKGTVSINNQLQLRPGAKYTIEVIDGKLTVQFTFEVDKSLTPWNEQPDSLRGAPVAWLSRQGRPPILVAAMTDPSVTVNLDPSQWSDKDGDGAVSLVFYPPVDAAKSIFSRVGDKGPLPVLLSDFSDALTAQVVSSSSKWRVVSFSGDSHILGCEDGEKGCNRGRGFDYQSGGYAIVDQSGQRARVWARPEWTGETLLEVSGQVLGQQQWNDVRAANFLVAGYRRNREGRVASKESDTSDAFRSGLRFASLMPGSTKRIWWQTRSDMAAVIMDAMRNSLKTDLAMADQRNIDPEVIEELRLKAEAGLMSTIGPDELLEILWRHDAYTVVKITGKDLAAALVKLAKLQADDDGGSICVRGLGGQQFEEGCTIPQALKPDQLEVNGRYFNADEFYSVALSQGTARAADLTYSRKKAVNVFDEVLDYVIKLTPEELERISPEKTEKNDTKYSPKPGQTGTEHDESEQEQTVAALALPFIGQSPTVGSQAAPAGQANASGASAPSALNWPNLLVTKWQGLIYIPPAAIELGGQNFSVPDRQGKPDVSGFAAIPQVGEKAQHTFKFNLVGELHVVPLDLPFVSLDLFSRVNLNRLDTYPNSASGFTQFSYTPDQWTNGAAIRSKVVTDTLTKISAPLGRRLIPAAKRQAIRLQPFVGYFDDTSVFHYAATYARTADKAVFQQSDAKPNYAYLGLGVEVSPITLGKYITLKGTKLEQDWGMNYVAPKGVQIAGSFFSMDDVRRCGVQNLIDGKQGCPAAQDGPGEVRYRYVTQRQSRQQIATSVEFARGADPRKMTLTVDIKATRWGTAPGGFTALDPVRTAEFVVKSSFPLGAGISFGPYYRYLTVNAYGSDGNFISKRYGFTLTVPLTAKTGHGRFFF